MNMSTSTKMKPSPNAEGTTALTKAQVPSLVVGSMALLLTACATSQGSNNAPATTPTQQVTATPDPAPTLADYRQLVAEGFEGLRNVPSDATNSPSALQLRLDIVRARLGWRDMAGQTVQCPTEGEPLSSDEQSLRRAKTMLGCLASESVEGIDALQSQVDTLLTSYRASCPLPPNTALLGASGQPTCDGDWGNLLSQGMRTEIENQLDVGPENPSSAILGLPGIGVAQ